MVYTTKKDNTDDHYQIYLFQNYRYMYLYRHVLKPKYNPLKTIIRPTYLARFEDMPVTIKFTSTLKKKVGR